MRGHIRAGKKRSQSLKGGDCHARDFSNDVRRGAWVYCGRWIHDDAPKQTAQEGYGERGISDEA